MLVGGVLASGLQAAAGVLADQPPPWDTRQELIDRGVRLDAIAAEPLVADWRAAIAACGLKPSTYKSSPEQLARRVLKSGPLETGLALVDAYCDVATRHLAPLGGYDVARLPGGDVRLRLADPDADEFHPLGGRDGEMPLGKDVAVYAIGSTVICWAYNCRDSRDTCLAEDTDEGLFVGEAVTARQHGALRSALSDLVARLGGAGAAVGSVVYASAGSPSVAVRGAT